MKHLSIYLLRLRNRRNLLAIFVLLAISACGYVDEANEPPDFQIQSKNSLEFLAQCVTQDWDSAFPRMFPTKILKGRKSFRSYDGIQIAIIDIGDMRAIEARTPKSLNGAMISYLRKCSSDIWWKGR